MGALDKGVRIIEVALYMYMYVFACTSYTSSGVLFFFLTPREIIPLPLQFNVGMLSVENEVVATEVSRDFVKLKYM